MLPCMTDCNDWLNTSVTARIIGIAEATVRSAADRGDLPTVRTAGGARLFRRRDVEEFARRRIAQRRHRSVSIAASASHDEPPAA
jgi:excisionase family DNA binding protein